MLHLKHQTTQLLAVSVGKGVSVSPLVNKNKSKSCQLQNVFEDSNVGIEYLV